MLDAKVAESSDAVRSCDRYRVSQALDSQLGHTSCRCVLVRRCLAPLCAGTNPSRGAKPHLQRPQVDSLAWELAALQVLRGLGVLQERRFDDGSGRLAIPLRSLVAASHHPPDEHAALAALYDRFLIRKRVSPLSAEGRLRLLDDPPVRTPHSSSGRAQEAKCSAEAQLVEDDPTRVLDQGAAGLLGRFPRRTDRGVVTSSRMDRLWAARTAQDARLGFAPDAQNGCKERMNQQPP